MSTKYSEIYTATPVVTADPNDLVILAKVDGGSPTGYSTKGLLVSDFLAGVTLQSVLDADSYATGLVSDVQIEVDDAVVWLQSEDTANNDLGLFIIDGPGTYSKAVGYVWTEGASGNSSEITIGSAKMLVRDDIFSKGLEYNADYSANFIDESLVTKRYVDASGGANIYSINGALAGARVVTLTDLNTLSFTGGQTTFIGQNDLVSKNSLVATNFSAQKILQVRNDGSIVFGIDTGGATPYTFSFKTSNYSNMFAIEDAAGNDYFAFKAGQITMHSNNSIVGGNTSELRMCSINNVYNTTWRAQYDGSYSMILRNASQDIAEFYTEGAKKRVVHLGMGGNASVKISGSTTYDLNLSLDVRDSGNVAHLNVSHATGNVAIGQAGGTARLTVNSGTSTGFVTEFKRDFTGTAATAKGYSSTITDSGSEVRTVRLNGAAFAIKNEWNTGDNRLSFDFVASVNNNMFRVYDAATGLVVKAQFGDEISWWNGNGATGFGFGFGHSAPNANTVHSKIMDWKIEGALDANLLNIDSSTNQISSGSTPYANVMYSITNSQAQTYSFLVLNQDTTKEFSVRETGEVVMSNIQLNIGSTLIGTEKAIIGGQTIINSAALVDQFYYSGDGGTSKGFSIGQTVALGNHFYMDDTAGVNSIMLATDDDSYINSSAAGNSLIIGAAATILSGAKLQVNVKVGDGAIPCVLLTNDNNHVVVLNTTNDNSGFGTETPDTSSAVEVASTTGGFLIPRMTAVQATAIGTPADGLLLYVTTTNATFGFVGHWKREAGAWLQF